MKYTIYFELFGRKMKHTVTADSISKARDMVKVFILSRLIIIDVKPKGVYNPFDFLTDVVNGKK